MVNKTLFKNMLDNCCAIGCAIRRKEKRSEKRFPESRKLRVAASKREK